LGSPAVAPGRAHCIGAESTLLPDHSREEFQRQIVGTSGCVDHQTHRIPQIGYLQTRTGDRVACTCDFGVTLNLDSHFVLLFVYLDIASILIFVSALDGSEPSLALKLQWLNNLSVNFVVSIPECDTLA
jgi:hypothetical protein